MTHSAPRCPSCARPVYSSPADRCTLPHRAVTGNEYPLTAYEAVSDLRRALPTSGSLASKVYTEALLDILDDLLHAPHSLFTRWDIETIIAEHIG